MSEKVVAIIPARGGSKSITRKNISPLNGHPLVFYSIKAALESKYITECYVSTEDSEIASIAKYCGAKIIRRPAHLAEDYVSTFDVVKHAVEFLGFPEVIVILQPTSPLRTGEDIDVAFGLMQGDVAAVVGVCEFHGYFWAEDTETAKPLFKERLPRQKMGKLYLENGALYITRKDVFIQNDFQLGMGIPTKARIKLHVMEKKHSIEIDSKDDLFIVESLLRRRDYGNYKDRR